MKNVKIYKIYIEQSYEISTDRSAYSLSPWGENTAYYKGDDDGGRDYILPDGYEVALNANDDLTIFNAKAKGCDLIKYNGKPAIEDTDSDYPIVLELAKEPELISLSEYANLNSKDERTLRKKAEDGGFATARKIGRNWVIDRNEICTDNRKK